jgi:hypothetical protein
MRAEAKEKRCFNIALEEERDRMQNKTWRSQSRISQKTTEEIHKLLSNAKLDRESITNRALNDYLPKIFHTCPFTDELCTSKQCIECAYSKKQNVEAKPLK